MESHRRLRLSLGLALSLMTLAVYAQVWRHQFTEFDDPIYVVHCPLVQKGLTAEGVREAFTTFRATNWHPLTWVSLMADRQLFGNNAGAFHVTNLVLHLANTLLLFVVLDRMTGAVWRSGLVAALFAIHPLHVESVAWVSERKDVLSTFFWMLVLGAYDQYVGRPSWLRYGLVVLFLALGLLAKPMLVTLPCVLLLLDYWPFQRIGPASGDPASKATTGKRKRGKTSSAEPTPENTSRQIPTVSWQRACLEKLPFLTLAISASAITLYAQAFSVATLSRLPVAYRLSNAATAYVTYLVKTLWPSGLACFYPWQPIDWWSPWPALATLFLVAVTVFVVRRKESPWLHVGWFWYLGTLVPVIGIVHVGMQSHADRYTYVPLIGIFLMAAWSVPTTVVARFPKITATVVAAGLAGLMLVAWRQVGYWHDTRTLFERDLAVTGGNAVAHINLGIISQQAGRIAEAETHYKETLRLNPESDQAHTLLANIAERRGDVETAISHCREALRINPNTPDVHVIYGTTLVKSGNLKSAIEHFRIAVRLAPDMFGYRYNLGLALADDGRLSQASDEFRAAIRVQPNAAIAYQQLGIVLARMGKHDEARAEFRKAVQLDPRLAEEQRNLQIAP